jgi:hypothetical protein
MGHLDDPLNTFWQLLIRDGIRWHLATPPGVASNGGLVVSSVSSSLLAGFGPSQDLHFSPLARTTDQGSSWQTGVLPNGLSLVPDALAQRAGTSLALLHASGGTVVTSSSTDLSSWKTVITASALRRETNSDDCNLGSLTAISLTADGRTVVGGSCTQGGRAGLFIATTHGWTAVGPTLHGASKGPTEVVRLDRSASGMAALVSVGSGATVRLFAVQSANGIAGWKVSSGLKLNGDALLSTGQTADGGFVVVRRDRGTVLSGWVVSSNGLEWKPLPQLPAGTTSVTAGSPGTFQALVPDQSVLSVYDLGTTGWTRTQTLHLAIPYGSSN